MPTKTREKRRIITPEELPILRRPLPKSWTNAIGILKGKKIDAVGYQRRIRQAWDRRIQKQIKGASL